MIRIETKFMLVSCCIRAQSGRGALYLEPADNLVSAGLQYVGERENKMHRADRLSQIIQILRRSARPVSSGQLAAELEVSKSSVYRNIADLMGQRVPIQGEGRVVYVPDHDFDMPPLMLTPDKLEAAVLGAQWVAERGDAVLTGAAHDLLAKIAAAVPERLHPFVTAPSLDAPASLTAAPNGLDISPTCSRIRRGRKIIIRCRDG
jgi:predicted DNA-binding transcriptional regulator YafY